MIDSLEEGLCVGLKITGMFMPGAIAIACLLVAIAFIIDRLL